MLLVIDIGNTNTVLGVFDGSRLVVDWRLETKQRQTADEYGILARNLFALAGMEVSRIQHIVIASVVPPLNSVLEQMALKYFKLKPLFVEPGVKTGMPVLYDSPADVGADRIVNAVAAYEKYGGPAIVVDFGTATTFDAISAKGEYLGGVITPGPGISAEALFTRTARLPRVEIKAPAKVIGTSTVGSIQSGLYYGYIGLIDGILERMIPELGPKTKVVATGGYASLIGTGSSRIQEIDPNLTLEGLRLIYERNKG
ncbi:MAG: type III pantothenate kinase [Acidobacteria bacterium]|nr:type III pantothenate kinase [Acidobacteriota bacterium]MCI0722092.1 type III pantothenate kinase [Acidobacteriota bacterium]